MIALDLDRVALFLLTAKGLQAKCIRTGTLGRHPHREGARTSCVGNVAGDLALLPSALDVTLCSCSRGGGGCLWAAGRRGHRDC